MTFSLRKNKEYSSYSPFTFNILIPLLFLHITAFTHSKFPDPATYTCYDHHSPIRTPLSHPRLGKCPILKTLSAITVLVHSFVIHPHSFKTTLVHTTMNTIMKGSTFPLKLPRNEPSRVYTCLPPHSCLAYPQKFLNIKLCW